MPETEVALRSKVVATCRALAARGLVAGTSGNVSVRCGDGVLLSPSGVMYDAMSPEMVVFMRRDGSFDGPLKPTSEWHFHLEILKRRAELNAVVHTHSPFATSVAILGRDIPALHYRIAVVGGPTVRCAPYETYGTEALAERAVEALVGRRACLLAHHGVIAAHATVEQALEVAEVVEELARYMICCLPSGHIPVLPDDEVARVIEKYQTYGQLPGG